MALKRFSISLDNELLKRFDDIIKRKRYNNRSKVIADLIRNYLVEEEWKFEDRDSIGTINIVYDHHKRNLLNKLTEVQHKYHSQIVSDTHVHLDHNNCLEVIIVKGKTGIIKKVAEDIIKIKGIKFGKLSIATKGKEL